MLCVTERGECFPLTKTDGVHHISKEEAEKKKNGQTCSAVKEGQGKREERPWTSKKNETKETQFNTPSKNLQASVRSPFDNVSKMSRCEISGAHHSDYKATA